jgi:filamentous hemagglutinin family protein
VRYSLLILLAAAAKSLAAPQGLNIAQGDVSYKSSDPNSHTISASDQAILDWSDFSIDLHERVEFVQPSFDAIAINRVMGANPSQIFGQLIANGKVVLVNPQGVFVGKEAIIDTGSWIASTLDLNADVFSKTGELEFEGSSEQSVINEGSISAKYGDLFLMGKHVQNRGTLKAVGQLSGTIGASFVKLEKGGIFVRYNRTSNDSQNPYANAFAVVDGKITNPGGKVYVFGETVGLSSSAVIDVSHDTHPGEIFIGGDFHGKNRNFANANWSFVEPGASIRADALLEGSGGRVIVWADRDTVFQGEIWAQGSEKGGFAEVSGKNELHFEGLAHLGHEGTLLLDPTQITITGATSGVALGNCGFPGNTYASTLAAGTLSAATLVGVLNGGTSVIVTTADGTCGPFAGTGDIIVTSAVAWSVMPATLTLNASRDILVRASIQETNAVVTAADRVILTAGRNITIGGGAGLSGAVGSQNGRTTVTAGGDLLIGGAGSGYSRIGVNAITPCTGSIVVSCNNLTMQSGASATQIGHGRLNAANPGLVTTGADITVNALGNISMTGVSGTNTHCKIGHGSAILNAGNNQDGDITVISGGNLTMTGIAAVAATVTIGHGPGFGTSNQVITLSGNIDVQVPGTLSITGASGAFGIIGHGSLFTQTRVSSFVGDINLCCGGDANLLGSVNIGHRSTAPLAGHTVTGDLDISIGGSIVMVGGTGAATSGQNTIGFVEQTVQLLSGTLNLSACGNTSISTPTSASNVGIGYISGNVASTTRANIAIGGNFTATALTIPFIVGSELDLNFAVGGNLTASMSTVDGFISSGTLSATRIFVGGNLTASSNGGAVLALGAPRFLLNPCATLDVRAGGDIQWANNYTLPFTGAINIQAGHTFAAGELWSGNSSPQLVSICSQLLSPAFDLRCGSCSQFTSASGEINPICGGFGIQGAGGPTQPINFLTTAALTLSSLCTTCAGASSSLLIGGAGNNIALSNPVGPLDIGAFNSIDINQNINSTGSILITSCHDLNLNPGFAITSTGLNSPITLTADVDDSGMGNLNLLGGNITSNDGVICLSAGPGTFGCSSSNCFAAVPGLVLGGVSSVNHLSGLITSGSGETIVVASGNITIDGAATSIGTTSGSVALTAGGSIDINEDIISTAGAFTSISGQDTSINDSLVTAAEEIRMIAGNDLSLTGAATLSSLNSSVTLVVDSQFPFPPFIGTGAFNMSCGSQILSGLGQPVRIFTALSNSNTVCASALINGQGVVLGPLFEDTQTEVWCAYFSCPNPYPFTNLGSPFTIFYKNCLQRATQEAMVIVDQLLVSFHPYNEFPGWEAEFWLSYDLQQIIMPEEAFMIRRRNLTLLNNPKSYTLLLPE